MSVLSKDRAVCTFVPLSLHLSSDCTESCLKSRSHRLSFMHGQVGNMLYRQSKGKRKQCRAAIEVNRLLIRCCFQLCHNSLREVDLGSCTRRLESMMNRGSNIEIRLLCKPKNPCLLIQTKSKGWGTSLHPKFYLA